jgi:Domain of unknown function (DUF4386)
MYRSGLVPQFIGLLGLIGGLLVFASATAVLSLPTVAAVEVTSVERGS